MKITRQDAVINIARMRKNSWNVCFALALGDDDILDLTMANCPDFVQMADDIIAYIDSDRDRLLYEYMMQLTDSKPIWDYLRSTHEYHDHDQKLESIATSLDRLWDFANELYRSCGKGKLIPYFCNEKAVALLQRAVDAGILNEDFMPAENTQVFQLKLIAIAFNQIIGCGRRDQWCHFVELWGRDVNRRIVPLTKGTEIYKIIHLYPEADFSEIISPKNKKSTLTTDLTTKQATKLWHLLVRNRYVDKKTSLDDFLSILGLSYAPYTPVNWTSKGMNSLVYFIMALLRPLNNDLHRKAVDCFTYNGQSLNYGTLKSKCSYVMRFRDKMDFIDMIDGIIDRARNE